MKNDFTNCFNAAIEGAGYKCRRTQFAVLYAHDGYSVVHVGDGFKPVAYVRQQGKSLEITEYPSVSGMPSHISEEARSAMKRIRANHHFHSCYQPDGRGPTD